MSEYAGVIAFFLGLMLGGVWGFLSGLLWPGSRVWHTEPRRTQAPPTVPMPKRLEL